MFLDLVVLSGDSYSRAEPFLEIISANGLDKKLFGDYQNRQICVKNTWE